MNMKESKRLLVILAVIYWVFAIGIYAIAFPQFRYEQVSGKILTADSAIGEIVDGNVLRQNIAAPADVINEIKILTSSFERENTGTLTITVKDSAGAVLARRILSVSSVENNQYTTIPLDDFSAKAGQMLTIELYTNGCAPGNAITVYASGVTQSQPGLENYSSNGQEARGTLCIALSGHNNLMFYKTYWVIVITAFVLIAAYAGECWKKAKQGENNSLVAICTVYTRYSFLIKQLVARDFKTKYKRSVLGMAWSVMSPLLTMAVQYLVFSRLFKSGVPNYPVYLLTGIVFFGFFSEAVNMGMGSILGNASLIKKVYMPKYIYPVTRVISSLVNFGLSLLPLCVMIIATGTPLRLSMLLILFDILCYLAFIIGLTLLLATATTFFQDMQFLWGILSMVWQYLTPIFYPESIIPEQFLAAYRMNPLYQFITFARTCIIDGVSPAPLAYLQCILSGAVMLILGIAVFKRHQDKFILYL